MGCHFPLKRISGVFLAITMMFLPNPALNGLNNLDAIRLEEARKLSREGKVKEALLRYETLADTLQKDPDLLIEWGRALGRAGRNKEAVLRLEVVRKNFPERESEILHELADQYKWSDRSETAVPIYREILESRPEDVNVLLGLAQALAWSDQHSEAVTIYEQILKLQLDNIWAILGKAEILSWQDRLEEAAELYLFAAGIDPENITAQNGLARMQVWKGYNRVGAEKYMETLETRNRPSDTIEGLAQALAWDGMIDDAVSLLDGLIEKEPERESALKLRREITDGSRPYITVYRRASFDSNTLEVTTLGGRAGWKPGYMTDLGLLVEGLRLRQDKNQTHLGRRLGLNGGHRFGRFFEANTALYLTDYSPEDWKPFTSATWFTLRPYDTWRFDLSYNKESIEDITALEKGISFGGVSLSADWKPDRFWLGSLKLQGRSYSDDNTQDEVLFKLERRISTKPYLKWYYNYYFSEWDEQKNNGYFNPLSIQSHVLGLYLSGALTQNLFGELKGSFGFERLIPDAEQNIYFISGALRYGLKRSWSASVQMEYFLATPVGGGTGGYRKRTVFLTLTYSFGGEPGGVKRASEPARPAWVY